MSILLEPRSRKSDSREGIVQQPGSFYNGNPSSSIWGRSSSAGGGGGGGGGGGSGSSSSWKNVAASPFEFFSKNPQPPPPPPPPVEILRFEKPTEPEIFVFGSSSNRNPSTAVHENVPDPINPTPAAADRKNDRSRGSSSSSGIQDQEQTVENVGSMLHGMRIGTAGDTATFLDGDGDGFTKTFAVGTGGDSATPQPTAAYHQPVNPRPRFSKLRKSTHQGKGKGVASNGQSFENLFGGPTRSTSDPANFHTGEPSNEPIVEKQDERRADSDHEKNPFTYSDPDHEKNRFTSWFNAGNTDGQGGEPDSATVFTFTSMRDSVPVFPVVQEMSDEAKSVAADLNNLKLEKQSEKGSETGFVFGARVEDVFVFRASGGSERVDRQDAVDSSFVFKAAGGSSFVPKKKSKKAPGRVKQIRSTSTSASDEQGSPMDFSPCPEMGARLSPPLTATNSESEEREPLSNRSSEPADEVEKVRAAAAELNLGNESEDVRTEDDKADEAQEKFVFGKTESSFSFTSSPSDAPRRRPPRRAASKAGASKAKSNSTRSRTKEDFEMDLDKNKSQMMDYAVPSTPSPTSTRAAVEQACEKWRLRGNQAYANGDFPKAEECYSRGASSVPSNETSQSCIHASMLCYSNRAATRMVLGRMREALADCKRAMSVDPNFLRVKLRAGSCYLALGENDAAATCYKDCLFRVRDHDRNDLKTASEASEGLRKAQQAQDYFKRVRELSSDNDFAAALCLVNEALPISPYSETLLTLKARCLLSARKFDEAVEMCEQTLTLAESNWPADPLHSRSSPQLWRSWVTSKALFCLGRLEDSLDCLQKLGNLLSQSGTDKISQVFDADGDSFSQFSTLLHDLLRHKAAGNEDFQAGRHTEAVENYTAALACNSDARPFNAVLFCNRAAAYQALGHIADAIADSSRAVVLDSKYAKAISRRATLHTAIRDYSHACVDLRRLTSLLENQARDNPRRAGQDLKQARERLACAEEDMKKSHPIDHYLILGLEPACSAVDIKKAYRKLALRHHPDKAGQLFGGEDGSWWKEAAEEIRNDAERLFKLIGEAYAILSDPFKRSRYDSDEELRKVRTRSGLNATTGAAESYRYQTYERSGGRRQRDSWAGYKRWQSGPDAAQPDSYARYARGGSGVRSTDYSWDDL